MSVRGAGGAAAAAAAAGFLLLVAAVVLEKRGKRPVVTPPFERPTAYVRDVDLSEAAYDVANASVKRSFMKALREMDWGRAKAALAPGFLGKFPAPGAGTAVPDAWMGIREYGAEGLPDLGAAAFVATIRDHMADWVAVERTTWRPFEFLLDPGHKSAYVVLHFEFGGRRPDGMRSDLAGTVRSRWVTADEKTWLVERLEWVEGTRLDARRPPWIDITDETGLNFNESPANREIRRSMINDRGITNTGGLVVSDWNRDEFPDVLAWMRGGELALFLNDGKGGFVRGRGPEIKLDDVSWSYMVLDLDGDGVDELVSGDLSAESRGKANLKVHVRRGDGWDVRRSEFQVPPGTEGVVVQGIVPSDFDRDGDIDLYLCCYKTRNSKDHQNNRVMDFGGADNYLFINQGGLRFTEESDARGITGTQFSYVAKWWDFDFDGDLDLFEGNDFGPNHLFVNDGAGRFVDDKTHLFNADTNYTMGVTIADSENDGTWGMYISNMYSHAGNRVFLLAENLGPEMRRLGLLLAQGNQYYERDPRSSEWRETSIARRVNWADWAWACLFLDFDNDGDREIFVANGFTTNTDANAPDF
ncbi:MAG: ASPIC/UnbV domain-containing [Planctomycetota bacterium]|nr:MAG: ASPIC/UnbV domain-containing [Planctomycetota bacterium]